MTALPERHARIFLLSHMRAFTSLAGHIIGSHPQVNGYFEMHISYDDPSALDKQLDIFLQSEAIKPGSRYLFDKLLHNDYLLQPESLGVAEIRILLALREPEQTIKSVVNLFANKDTDELYASPLEAAKYYIDRVSALADFCRDTDRDYCYFDASLLQDAPDILVPAISHWLDLDSPLVERYQIFSQTGRAGKGDSSHLIHSGKIDKAKVDYSHIRIPENVLKKAREVYRDCRRQIIENAADSVIM